MTPEMQMLLQRIDALHLTMIEMRGALHETPTVSVVGGDGGVVDRELMANEIDPATADGKFVQSDGSVWGKNPSTGRLEQLQYGYITRQKDPAMYDRMAALMGPERLAAVLAQNGPRARYKVHPNTVLSSGDPNTINLAYVLNPIPGGA